MFVQMEDLKFNSYKESRMQLENSTYVDSGTHVNPSSSYMCNNINKIEMFKEVKFKKSKSTSKNWCSIVDPELQRKKRVSSYKVYTMEGKVKKCFHWIKVKCIRIFFIFRGSNQRYLINKRWRDFSYSTIIHVGDDI